MHWLLLLVVVMVVGGGGRKLTCDSFRALHPIAEPS
jgi:hypothetical protein